MNDGRAREVHVAMAEVHGLSQLRQPSAAPDPASEYRIKNGAHEDLAQQKRPESDPLTDGADNNVTCRLHEHDFEQGQAEAAGVVTWTTQKKTLPTEKAPEA